MAQWRSLDEYVDVLVLILVRHRMSLPLLLRLMESRVLEKFHHLTRPAKLVWSRQIPGLIRLRELEHRSHDRVDRRGFLGGAPHGDANTTLRCEDSVRFPRDLVGIGENLETESTHSQVERLIGEVHLLGVHHAKFDVRYPT